ncbi:MAG: N-acetylmuramoyl-L-alanine amidase [Deltaproteobacteria bacterium]|nr:N-acetylmuramoyl-L-alanine amidase [Deltaproteobacteria bacterium]
MGKIIIAGNGWSLPDDVRVRTFMDPGGFSFYRFKGGELAPLVYVDEDDESRSLVIPRRLPQGGRAGLGGLGWDPGDGSGDRTRALRKVISTVVLHHDGCRDSAMCYRVLVNRGFSTHFMIDLDGTVYQAADVADQTLHAAGINSMGVGIDLNNPAQNLLSDPDAEAPGRRPSAEKVINGVSFRSWDYSEAQYRSLIAVLRVLTEVLGIEPVFPVGEDGLILNSVLDSPPAPQFKGIQCHWHSSAFKWDPGPGLDWERILAGLRSEDATMPAVPVGMAAVIRAGVHREHLPADAWSTEEDARRVIAGAWESEDRAERLCRSLCRAMEKNSAGGYYPVGVNQTWHNGIHVPVEEGALVRPMLAGDLVAAHLVKSGDFPSLGSNNFVLLRHRIPLPPRFEPLRSTSLDDGEQGPLPDNVLTVFSLYMHLDGVDLESPPDTGLFGALAAHAGGAAGTLPPPPGPTLQTLPEEADQFRALKAGYVGLFSAADNPEAALRLTPRDVLWRAGEFGPEGERRRIVHVEVFADPGFSDAMELGLYGKYLQLGPDEPESRDLMVRSWSLLGAIGGPEHSLEPMVTEKVLNSDVIRDFFEYDGDDEQAASRERMRRLITRHVSEWSDGVRWVEALFAAQDAQGWRRRFRRSDARWIFGREVMTYLPYVWLTEEVSNHIGARWNDGVYSYFHPVYFLLWWMFRRSAVRGKSLEQILKEVGGEGLSSTRGVSEILEDLLDIHGNGEWEM